MTGTRPEGAASIDPDGGITVPAELIAVAFGLPPEDFMRKLRAGLISQVNEKGVDEDEGRHRLTFLYRRHRVVAVIEPDGTVRLER